MLFDPSGNVFLTIKDITQAISPDKTVDGLNKTLRQVRYWTQCDLIHPADDKNTGKGSPRLYYQDPTIMVAAILLELNRYGATVDILRPVSEALYEDEEETGGDVLFMAVNDEARAFLQVVWTEDEVTKKFTGADINLFHEWDREELEDLWTDTSSSVVINLNRLAERVYPLPWADEAHAHQMRVIMESTK